MDAFLLAAFSCAHTPKLLASETPANSCPLAMGESEARVRLAPVTSLPRGAEVRAHPAAQSLDRTPAGPYKQRRLAARVHTDATHTGRHGLPVRSRIRLAVDIRVLRMPNCSGRCILARCRTYAQTRSLIKVDRAISRTSKSPFVAPALTYRGYLAPSTHKPQCIDGFQMPRSGGGPPEESGYLKTSTHVGTVPRARQMAALEASLAQAVCGRGWSAPFQVEGGRREEAESGRNCLTRR
ncbi:hypothetical protein C8Q78DRAFT_288098 [Trametes maxima]|nr:hypothetical protein C8Q78DRAFT_288098 [Trametes maxima]